jgi:hypothetical protein
MPFDITAADWFIRPAGNLPRMFRAPEQSEASWADLTGSEIHCRIGWAGGEIALVSGAVQVIGGVVYGVWVENQAEPEWLGFLGVRLTEEQRASLPTGLTHARYRIEQWIEGDQRTLFEGDVIVTEVVPTVDGAGARGEVYGGVDSGLAVATRKARDQAAEYAGLAHLVVTADLTLTEAHRHRLLLVNGTEPVTITVPAGLEPPFRIEVAQIGAGAVGFDWAAVTLMGAEFGRDQISPAGRGAIVTIRSYADDVYLIWGSGSGSGGGDPGGTPGGSTTLSGTAVVLELATSDGEVTAVYLLAGAPVVLELSAEEGRISYSKILSGDPAGLVLSSGVGEVYVPPPMGAVDDVTFGDTMIGERSIMSITLTNLGTTPIELTDLSVSGDFAILSVTPI